MNMEVPMWSQTDFALKFCGVGAIGSVALADAIGSSKSWDCPPGVTFIGDFDGNFTAPLMVPGCNDST